MSLVLSVSFLALPAHAADTHASNLEQEMLKYVNEARQAEGLAPLQMMPELVDLARLKSKDMIDKNYFDHNSPTYGSPFTMLKNHGINYRTAGENLAGNSSVSDAHKRLMNSPGHRKNILNPSFTHVGIGIVPGGPYGMMFTQIFIGQTEKNTYQKVDKEVVQNNKDTKELERQSQNIKVINLEPKTNKIMPVYIYKSNDEIFTKSNYIRIRIISSGSYDKYFTQMFYR